MYVHLQQFVLSMSCCDNLITNNIYDYNLCIFNYVVKFSGRSVISSGQLKKFYMSRLKIHVSNNVQRKLHVALNLYTYFHCKLHVHCFWLANEYVFWEENLDTPFSSKGREVILKEDELINDGNQCKNRTRWKFLLSTVNKLDKVKKIKGKQGEPINSWSKGSAV